MLRGVRRLLLLAVLVAAGVALLQQPEQCQEQLADTGTAVEVCGPLEVTSPEVLLVLIVIGLLLLPELSELEIGGVLTLRRAVAEAKGEAVQARAEAAEARLMANQAAIATATQTAVQWSAQNAAQTTEIHMYQAAATGEAIKTINQPSRTGQAADGPDLADQRPTRGEASLVAFQAGLLGLAAQIGQVEALANATTPTQVGVLGFTRGADGTTLELSHSVRDEPSDVIDAATSLVNEQDLLPSEVVTGVTPGEWVLATLALTEDGRLVGALASVLRPAPAVTDMDDEALGALSAQVRVAAAGYAQLLVDLLGELPSEV